MPNLVQSSRIKLIHTRYVYLAEDSIKNWDWDVRTLRMVPRRINIRGWKFSLLRKNLSHLRQNQALWDTKLEKMEVFLILPGMKHHHFESLLTFFSSPYHQNMSGNCRDVLSPPSKKRILINLVDYVIRKNQKNCGLMVTRKTFVPTNLHAKENFTWYNKK